MVTEPDILCTAILMTPGKRTVPDWGEVDYVAAELARKPGRWVGRPVLTSHPVNADGSWRLIGNANPGERFLGICVAARYSNGALAASLLLRTEAMRRRAPEQLERLLGGQDLAVSLGASLSVLAVESPERQVIIDEPDHVAIVSEGSCEDARIFASTAKWMNVQT